MPLLGRCYFQFGHDCHTVWPDCGRRYRVQRDANKRTQSVSEETYLRYLDSHPDLEVDLIP